MMQSINQYTGVGQPATAQYKPAIAFGQQSASAPVPAAGTALGTATPATSLLGGSIGGI